MIIYGSGVRNGEEKDEKFLGLWIVSVDAVVLLVVHRLLLLHSPLSLIHVGTWNCLPKTCASDPLGSRFGA